MLFFSPAALLLGKKLSLEKTPFHLRGLDLIRSNPQMTLCFSAPILLCNYLVDNDFL